MIYSLHKERDIDWSYRDVETFIEDLVERNERTFEYVRKYEKRLEE